VRLGDCLAVNDAGLVSRCLNILPTIGSSCIRRGKALVLRRRAMNIRWLAHCVQVLINEQEVNVTDDSSCCLPNKRIFTIDIAPSGGLAETCSVTTLVH